MWLWILQFLHIHISSWPRQVEHIYGQLSISCHTTSCAKFGKSLHKSDPYDHHCCIDYIVVAVFKQQYSFNVNQELTLCNFDRIAQLACWGYHHRFSFKAAISLWRASLICAAYLFYVGNGVSMLCSAFHAVRIDSTSLFSATFTKIWYHIALSLISSLERCFKMCFTWNPHASKLPSSRMSSTSNNFSWSLRHIPNGGRPCCIKAQ